jgi:regulator of cell morphogenesis and NO signaling
MESLSITEFMIKQHEKIESMLLRFESLQEKDPKEAHSFFMMLMNRLQTHLTFEEEILFPLFEEKVPLSIFGPTHNLRTDHREMKTLLHYLAQDGRKGEKKSSLERFSMKKRLMTVYKNHRDNEDQILFPWLDIILEEKDKRDLISKLKENLSDPDPINVLGLNID